MSAISITVVAKIVEHHEHAQRCAADAVEHARQAGAMLLGVKADVGHGQFLQWIQTNVPFTARTAQRYMNAAAPRPKATRLSHSVRTPKSGSKRAMQLAAIDHALHCDEVTAHAAYLVAELPTSQQWRDTDLSTLIRLRDTLNTILSGAVLEVTE
jgi:hypothetical protein